MVVYVSLLPKLICERTADSVVRTSGPVEPVHGNTPCWVGVRKYDDKEGTVIQTRAGSDEPVNSAVRTSGPVEPVNGDIPCWTGDGESDNNSGILSYPGPGPMSQSTVLFVIPGLMCQSTSSVVRTSGPDKPVNGDMPCCTGDEESDDN